MGMEDSEIAHFFVDSMNDQTLNKNEDSTAVELKEIKRKNTAHKGIHTVQPSWAGNKIAQTFLQNMQFGSSVDNTHGYGYAFSTAYEEQQQQPLPMVYPEFSGSENDSDDEDFDADLDFASVARQKSTAKQNATVIAFAYCSIVHLFVFFVCLFSF